MPAPKSLKHLIASRLLKRKKRICYKTFGPFTMVPRGVFFDNLELAFRLRNISGCVVECGVWRGGMSAAIASVMGPNRKYYLFDSFEGLPPARAIDGEAALKWQSDVTSSAYFDNCKAPIEAADRAMRIAGTSDFLIEPGWFADTLPKHRQGEPIALLRLDADWYESTMDCLENLFDRVAPHGLIILDDYYTWDGCSRALHDFLSRRSATERIRSYGQVCFLERFGPTTK